MKVVLQKSFRVLVSLAVASRLWGCGAEVDVAGVEEELIPSVGVSQDEIVGGTNVNITNHPWLVSLQDNNGAHFCGGVILSEDFVLTTARCLSGKAPSDFRLVGGTTLLNLSNTGQVRSASTLIRHPAFLNQGQSRRGDLALVLLDRPFNLSSPRVKAISMLPASLAGMVAEGVKATVSGWGALSASNSTSANALQAVEVSVVSNASAQAAYPGETLFSDQLATADLGKGPCVGDAGGPLVVRDSNGTPYLAGLVSWGQECGSNVFPTLYTRVSSFETWVTTKMLVYAPPGGSGADAGTPGGVTDGGTPATSPFPGYELVSTNESGSRNSWKHFTLVVPARATLLNVTTLGGSGDVDLYVRKGATPTLTSYHCRSRNVGNFETCAFNSPGAGTFHISLRGHTSFNRATVVADYQ